MTEKRGIYAAVLPSKPSRDTIATVMAANDAERAVLLAMREPVKGHDFPCLTLVYMGDGNWRMWKATSGGGVWIKGNKKASDGR